MSNTSTICTAEGGNQFQSNFNPKKKVIAGTGCESTRETIRLTKRAADLGAEAALIVTPHYYKGSMTNEALKTWLMLHQFRFFFITCPTIPV